MSKQIMVYENWGVLAHEYEPVYSARFPMTAAYNYIILTVDVPTWTDPKHEPGVTIDGTDYLLNEVLSNWGDAPALVWYDGNNMGRNLRRKLKSRKATPDEISAYNAGEWLTVEE